MKGGNQALSINITTGTIFKVIAIFILIFLLYLIRDVLALLFIGLVLSAAIDPWVDWFAKRRIPRSVTVIFTYLICFGVLGLVVYLIIPPIISQFNELSTNLPAYTIKAKEWLSVVQTYSAQHGWLDNLNQIVANFNSTLQNWAGGIFSTVIGFFGAMFSFILVLFFIFYMSVEESAIKQLILSLTPAKRQDYALHLVNRMQRKVGLWLRGQLILCLTIFLMVYIGLTLLGVKYALILALIAGLTEAVPYLGPLIGAVPAVFLSFTQEPLLALFVIILYWVIQEIENNILVPKIMQKAVGLHPIISLAVLIIGFELGGIVGAILSIPVTTALSVFIEDLIKHKGRREQERVVGSR